MENFIFYYTLFRNYKLAKEMMQKDSTFAKEFLDLAKKICELESQTFLTRESKKLLSQLKNSLFDKAKTVQKIKLSNEMWRLYAGLMCTFQEWCIETRFFEMSPKEQNFIFPENPIDGYFEVINEYT